MSILDTFLLIAQHEIGVAEFKDGNNPRIIEYDATTTLKATNDDVPWCSAFVNWVVKQAGVEGTNSAAARSWLEWGEEITDPVPGCIVVMKRGINPEQGHVFFFKSVSSSFITGVGGNQHKSVNISGFFKSNLLSYRVPKDWKDL